MSAALQAPDGIGRDARVGSSADARRLAGLARDCAAAGIGRRLLLLRLSRLGEGLLRGLHLQLAYEALLPLSGAARAQFFHLPNHDLGVAWRGETPLLQQSLDGLRHLFADDHGFGQDPMALATVLSLPEDGQLVQRVVEESLWPRPTAAPARGARRPLDPATLVALERAIAQADMSRFARREKLCRPAPEGFRLLWERRHLSVEELFETILPDRAPRADPWLFRRLTRTLDKRMLALLCLPDEVRGVAPFSLDLNVASLLAPEFLRFDASLPAALRGAVVINLRAEDILADPATFCFARDFVAARGYRTLLHDVGPLVLGLLPPARLGVDFVQLKYSERLAWPDGLDPERVVLGGVDSAAALAWGRARHVGGFQGRIVGR